MMVKFLSRHDVYLIKDAHIYRKPISIENYAKWEKERSQNAQERYNKM